MPDALHTWLRVQDRHGGGPFRSIITDRWRDIDGNDFPAIQEQFGLDWLLEIPRRWHCGCALRTMQQVVMWFSASECARMDALGYRLVRVHGRALRESAHQALIVRRTPFRTGAVIVPWPHIEPTAALDPWKALTDA